MTSLVKDIENFKNFNIKQIIIFIELIKLNDERAVLVCDDNIIAKMIINNILLCLFILHYHFQNIFEITKEILYIKLFFYPAILENMNIKNYLFQTF